MADRPVARDWRRFVALGDSFTEGLMDEIRHDGRHLGWADRVAQSLADRARAERRSPASSTRTSRSVVDWSGR